MVHKSINQFQKEIQLCYLKENKLKDPIFGSSITKQDIFCRPVILDVEHHKYNRCYIQCITGIIPCVGKVGRCILPMQQH